MTTAERLKWIFAAFFVLCALPFALAGDRDSELAGLFAGLAVMCLGGFALCLAAAAWQSGEIDVQDFRYKRAEAPRRFMATLLLITAAGLGTLASGLWFLAFK